LFSSARFRTIPLEDEVEISFPSGSTNVICAAETPLKDDTLRCFSFRFSLSARKGARCRPIDAVKLLMLWNMTGKEMKHIETSLHNKACSSR